MRIRLPVSGFTIDGPTSKDLDDAIWVRPEGKGYMLEISIADASKHVFMSSPLDRKAYQQGFTRYLAYETKPMLPHELSEDKLSLLPNKPRKTLTVSIPISQHGDVGRPTITRTTLTSLYRFSYLSAELSLQSTDGPYREELNTLNQIAHLLLSRRRGKGALAVYDPTHGWATTEDGQLYRLKPEESYNSHLIIQELMILTNSAVADFLLERKVPALFRNHTPVQQAPDRESILHELEDIEHDGGLVQIEKVKQALFTTMNPAAYGPTAQGHYGLNLPAYIHFTSPIRRYADMVNHRIVIALVEGKYLFYNSEKLEEMANHLNKMWAETRFNRHESLAKAAKLRVLTKVEQAGLHNLSGDDFRIFLKMAVKTGSPNDEMNEEILTRLQHNTHLNDKSMYYVLFATEPDQWITAKMHIYKWMLANAAKAQDVLLVAGGKLKYELTYKLEQKKEGEKEIFYCSATVVTPTLTHTSEVYTSFDRNQAKSQAALEIIRVVSGIAQTLAEEGEETKAVIDPNTPPQFNYKGRLFEYCQRSNIPPPVFKVTQFGGLSNATFTCWVALENLSSQTMSARTKKQAEQLAAKDFLDRYPRYGVRSPVESPLASTDGKNYVGLLQDLCVRLCKIYPKYTDLKTDAGFTFYCEVDGLTEIPIIEFAEAPSKRLAKHLAAQKAYKALRSAIKIAAKAKT